MRKYLFIALAAGVLALERMWKFGASTCQRRK